MGVQEAAIGAVMPYLIIGAVVVGAVVWYRREIGGAAAAVGEAGHAVVEAASGAGEDVITGYTESWRALSRAVWGDPKWGTQDVFYGKPSTPLDIAFYESLHLAGPVSQGYPTGIPPGFTVSPEALENFEAARSRLQEEARFKGVAGAVGAWFENLDKIVKIWG